MTARSFHQIVWTAGEALRRSLNALPSLTASPRRAGEAESSSAAELFGALEELDAYVRKLETEKNEVQTEKAILQRDLEIARAREKELRRLLLEAHEQLLNRDEEIQATLAHALRWAGRSLPSSAVESEGSVPTNGTHEPEASAAQEVPSKLLQYQEVIQHVRSVVDRLVPANASVLVVSKGDEELLRLGARKAGHFPQDTGGGYAGYYPKDSEAAIAHLEELRQSGAMYVVFPSPSLWWLEHYADLNKHLENRYCRVHQDQHCVLFHLAAPPSAWWRRWWQTMSVRSAMSRAVKS